MAINCRKYLCRYSVGAVGQTRGRLTPNEAVSPSTLCGSFLSTLLPSGPITEILLYFNSIGSVKKTFTDGGDEATVWKACGVDLT